LSQAEAAATAAARAATPTAAAAWDEDGGPGSPCSPHTVPSTGGTFWETAPPADVEPTCGRRRPTIEAQVRRAVAPRASPAPPTAAAGLGAAPAAAGDAWTDGPLALPPSVAPPTTRAAAAARPRLRRRRRVAGSVAPPASGCPVGHAKERPADGGESV